MNLHPVRGHARLLERFAGARRAGTLPAALLLHGTPGVGKQRVALWTAQLLLCEAPGVEGPCSECRSCRLALRLEHPDLHWYFPMARPKGASTPEKLEEALEDARFAELDERRTNPLDADWSAEPKAHYLASARSLRRRARNRPSMGDRQVFIIGDAETLVPQESSPEAANSLLKLLEEPPETTTFVLTSSEPGRVLTTIRSRCLPVHLPPLPTREVESFLVEVARAEPEEARRAAALSHGSIGRALGFLPEDGDPGPLDRLRMDALEILKAATDTDGSAFALALGYRPAGARGLLDLFAFVEEWLRDLAAVAAEAPGSVVNLDHRSVVARSAAGVDPVSVADAMDAVEEAREQARGNVNPQLIVADLVSRMRRLLATGAAA